MKLFSRPKLQDKVITYGVVLYWLLFWFFNVVDKFIATETFLWVGKDRMAQFLEYFSSVGIDNPLVAKGFLLLVTILQMLAFLFLLATLWQLFFGKKKKADDYFFWGTFFGLAIFSLFAMGDQIFGDRFELLEHTIYWISLIVSYGAYKYLPR